MLLLSSILLITGCLVNALVGNAVKFTEKGSITIRVRPVEQNDSKITVRFEVGDTGIGIPAETVPRLFRSFVQADTSTTRRFGGTGLGLAISKRLVELMNGRIGVESEVGRGSSFWFEIEFQKLEPADPPGVKSLAGQALVLVLTDDALRSALSEYLTQLGATVRAVGPQNMPGRWLRLEATERPTLILFDEDLLGWVEAGEKSELRRLQSGGCKLIALREPVARGQRTHSEGIEPDEVLLKPMKPRLLRECAAKCLPKSPAVPAASGPESEAAKLASPVNRGPLRILLAEDNPMKQRMLTLMLGKLGHHAEVVGDGQEALTALAKDHVDLVILASELPGTDGIEVSRQIRAHERQQGNGLRIHVAGFMSSKSGSERQSYLEAGMDTVLSQPLRLEEIQRLVETVSRPP